MVDWSSSISFCKLSLILTASFTKIQGDVEPGSAQQLCGILCVTFAKLPGSEKLLYLLFCSRLFVDYWASFSLLSVRPTNGIEDLVCSFKCKVSDNGPRLVFWWLFKVSLYCCSYCTERRNFEIFSVFLLHCCISHLSGSHLDLLSSSLLSEFQTLFGLKTIL